MFRSLFNRTTFNRSIIIPTISTDYLYGRFLVHISLTGKEIAILVPESDMFTGNLVVEIPYDKYLDFIAKLSSSESLSTELIGKFIMELSDDIDLKAKFHEDTLTPIHIYGKIIPHTETEYLYLQGTIGQQTIIQTIELIGMVRSNDGVITLTGGIKTPSDEEIIYLTGLYKI